MNPLFTSRITELFGIDLPVLAGGLRWGVTPDPVFGGTIHAGA